MASTYRLYGPAVGKDVVIVDATVTGVDTNGNIEFTPESGSLEPFSMNSDRLSELVDDNKAYDKSNLDTAHPIWKAVADVEERYSQITDDSGESFIAATEELFKGGV